MFGMHLARSSIDLSYMNDKKIQACFKRGGMIQREF